MNDQFGHEAGNELLRGTAHECSALIRTTDLAARYGGDEFVLVLVRTGLPRQNRAGAVDQQHDRAGGLRQRACDAAVH